MSEAVSFVRFHRAALARLAEQAAALDAREAELREQLAKLSAERTDMQKRREALTLAGQEFQSMYGWSDEAELPQVHPTPGHGIPAESARPRKARVGPQRYRVLIALRSDGRLSMEAATIRTRLPFRRVRDAMLNDVQLGVVAKDGDDYILTRSGLDLLSRFEAYKRSRGETLPTLDDPLPDEDREDGEPDDQPEEENTAP